MGKSSGIWIRARSPSDIVAAKTFVCMSSVSILQVDISGEVTTSEQAMTDWQWFLESLVHEIKEVTGKSKLQINATQKHIEALLPSLAEMHHRLGNRGLTLVDIPNVLKIPPDFIMFLKERQEQNWQVFLSDDGHHLYQEITSQDSGLTIKMR